MKIFGIGTDIVNIKRIEDALKKNGKNFKKRIFSANEIKYCENKKNPSSYFAKRFAAKKRGAMRQNGATPPASCSSTPSPASVGLSNARRVSRAKRGGLTQRSPSLPVASMAFCSRTRTSGITRGSSILGAR